ncbi:hypothetical protein F4859DRAFT_17370 [Xylaria cf. heliscus]|nr:hypothetical protein F4859DRAFT_17370 [Xylaria cf. heliscus]
MSSSLLLVITVHLKAYKTAMGRKDMASHRLRICQPQSARGVGALWQDLVDTKPNWKKSPCGYACLCIIKRPTLRCRNNYCLLSIVYYLRWVQLYHSANDPHLAHLSTR